MCIYVYIYIYAHMYICIYVYICVNCCTRKPFQISFTHYTYIYIYWYFGSQVAAFGSVPVFASQASLVPQIMGATSRRSPAASVRASRIKDGCVNGLRVLVWRRALAVLATRCIYEYIHNMQNIKLYKIYKI